MVKNMDYNATEKGFHLAKCKVAVPVIDTT